MSIDSPVADELIDGPQQAVAPAGLTSGVSFGVLRGVSPLLFSAATLLTGVGVAAAVATGANLALSLLVGYAAFAATIAMLRSAASPEQPHDTIEVIAA